MQSVERFGKWHGQQKCFWEAWCAQKQFLSGSKKEKKIATSWKSSTNPKQKK